MYRRRGAACRGWGAGHELLSAPAAAASQWTRGGCRLGRMSYRCCCREASPPHPLARVWCAWGPLCVVVLVGVCVAVYMLCVCAPARQRGPCWVSTVVCARRLGRARVSEGVSSDIYRSFRDNQIPWTQSAVWALHGHRMHACPCGMAHGALAVRARVWGACARARCVCVPLHIYV